MAQTNLVDSEIYGYIFEQTLSRIHTNLMIYIPQQEN